MSTATHPHEFAISGTNEEATAHAYIWDQITRQGRIPRDIAVFSLTLFEREALKLLERGSFRLQTRDELPDASPERLLILYHKNFRLGMRTGDLASWDDETDRFLVQLGQAPWQLLLAAQEATDRLLRLADSLEVAPFLAQLDEQGELHAILGDIADSLPHLAPLVAFVGDQIYSAEGYWVNNLLSRDQDTSVIGRLRAMPLAAWSMEDRFFVFAVYCLLLSGGAYRLEGMNWMQLDPLTIDQYLTERANIYASLIIDPLPGDSWSMSIPDKARRIKDLEGRLQEQFVFYRAINGTTLNKQLKCFPRGKLTPERLPEPLLHHLARRFGDLVSPSPPWQQMLTDVAVHAVQEHAIDALLVAFIESGLRETDSDFFMSRGPRHLYIPEHYAKLKKSDFYCAVLSRPGFDPAAHGLTSYDLGEIRWNQSCRMQFNGWKFWYGNLREDERPPDQYWFIPPRMPDIAYHEDALHAGHRANGVVQSIRSPGALRLRHRAGGEPRELIGMCDTRAARADRGRLYGEREVIATIHHQIWLTHILQTIAEHGWQIGAPVHIDAFDRAFHRVQAETQS